MIFIIINLNIFVNSENSASCEMHTFRYFASIFKNVRLLRRRGARTPSQTARFSLKMMDGVPKNSNSDKFYICYIVCAHVSARIMGGIRARVMN